MSAEDKTTWGEVCSHVGMSDNLYRTCRDKLGRSFKPADPLGLYDDAEEFEEDFDKELRKKALPVPKPPPKSKKKAEPDVEGFMEQILHGSLGGKIALWGGLAVVGAVLVKRFVIDAPKEAKAA